mgnify:FL=1
MSPAEVMAQIKEMQEMVEALEAEARKSSDEALKKFTWDLCQEIRAGKIESLIKQMFPKTTDPKRVRK